VAGDDGVDGLEIARLRGGFGCLARDEHGIRFWIERHVRAPPSPELARAEPRLAHLARGRALFVADTERRALGVEHGAEHEGEADGLLHHRAVVRGRGFVAGLEHEGAADAVDDFVVGAAPRGGAHARAAPLRLEHGQPEAVVSAVASHGDNAAAVVRPQSLLRLAQGCERHAPFRRREDPGFSGISRSTSDNASFLSGCMTSSLFPRRSSSVGRPGASKPCVLPLQGANFGGSKLPPAYRVPRAMRGSGRNEGMVLLSWHRERTRRAAGSRRTSGTTLV
jgi:hypothetical protein